MGAPNSIGKVGATKNKITINYPIGLIDSSSAKPISNAKYMLQIAEELKSITNYSKSYTFADKIITKLKKSPDHNVEIFQENGTLNFELKK